MTGHARGNEEDLIVSIEEKIHQFQMPQTQTYIEYKTGGTGEIETI